MRRVVPLFLLALLAALDAGAQRLPPGAVPLHYRITFAPDLARERFEGRETIDIQIDQATPRLTLNAVELKINDVTITSRGRTLVPEVVADASRGQVSFVLNRRLPPGTIKLDLSFSGSLTHDLRGLYLSEANGRKYAFTQFEATDARRAFPCFDEPSFKASFEISAVVDRGDLAISNGPVLSDRPGPGDDKHTVRFGTTQKMSSYLVALAVGDFECLAGSAAGGNVPIRVCAVPGRESEEQFALEAASRFLDFYNGYFSIRYPFRKLDLVAVPDFSAGAMENTAAIFFREQDLLIDPAASPLSSQYEVAATIAHEMAHQWFGDLVTMRWWDDLWLNEGFATWMESKPILGWKPEWHAELAEVRSASRAMDVDGLRATRPIRARVSSPSEIDEAFDAIAYDKAAAVLRMIEEYVTPDAFRNGINAYLRRFAYGNASAEDFWKEITAASGKPVDRILPAFVDQPGVPLVTSTSRCEGTDRTVAGLLQQRFLVAPAAQLASSTWAIPVELRGLQASAPGTAVVPVLLADRQADASLPGCAPLVLANAAARGYYRAEYPPEILARLAARPSFLTPAERIRLLDDEWALAQAGRREVASYLSLVQGFAGEASAEEVQAMAEPLQFVHDHLLTAADRRPFESWLQRIFQARARELGAPSWLPSPGEDASRRELRAAVMQILGTSARDPDVLKAARDLLEDNLRGASVDRALLPGMAALAALTAEPELYGRLAGTRGYQGRTPSLAEDEVLLEALTHAERPDLVTSALDVAASNRIRNQDTAIVLSELLANPAANHAAWDFIKARWPTLEKKIGGLLAEPTLIAATSSFCDPAARDDVRQFFARRVPQEKRTLDQAVERIDNCIAMRQRETPRIAAWLEAAAAPAR